MKDQGLDRLFDVLTNERLKRIEATLTAIVEWLTRLEAQAPSLTQEQKAILDKFKPIGGPR